MRTNDIIFLLLSLLPFFILLSPYIIALITKRKIQIHVHIAVFVTFVGLCIGLYLVYQEHNPGPAVSMTGIIFILWPFFAALGAIPTYFIVKRIAKYVISNGSAVRDE